MRRVKCRFLLPLASYESVDFGEGRVELLGHPVAVDDV